jgi:polysaccharide deacetylase family protein (PEP-CTERM system associated)
MNKDEKCILLTIDVEDWFQVENLKECIAFSSWPSCELRVERNTHRLLDMLDEASAQRSALSAQQSMVSPQSSDLRPLASGSPPQVQRSSSEAILQPTPRIRATFFVLGWIAERLPNLVREIHSRGHEVASHGYHHNLCSEISRLELRRDLLDSKKLLEDMIGNPVHGYRAPNFSISDDVLRIIGESGYLYDSSYNSFAMHGRYGKVDLTKNGKEGIAIRVSHEFFEVPISNLKFSGRVLPWGGGGYFRLIPFLMFRMGVKQILTNDNAYLFYMHPWEIDPGQPRMMEASRFYRFRHYVNLDKTYSRLRKLASAFRHCEFGTCHQYIQKGM